jgi:hypothetical protein
MYGFVDWYVLCIDWLELAALLEMFYHDETLASVEVLALKVFCGGCS